MGAEEERHAEVPAGELLRRLHRQVAAHHQRREGDDRAAANLPAADLGAFDAAVIAPAPQAL